MKLLSKLQPNPLNPRKITGAKFDRLKESIKKFPEMLEKRPIVFDENYMILGGQRRYEALVALEKEGFEVKESYFNQVTGWTEEQKREFTIKDNAHEGEWDIDTLREGWSDNPLDDWGLDFAANWKQPDAGEAGGEGSSSSSTGNTEIDPEELTKDHNTTCPRCGFEFEAEQVTETTEDA